MTAERNRRRTEILSMGKSQREGNCGSVQINQGRLPRSVTARVREGGTRPAAGEARRRKGLSQVDMAFDILKKARSPLHVSQILERIQTHFGITVDRESLVSSLTKKVARGDRFLRPEKNTFAVRPEAR